MERKTYWQLLEIFLRQKGRGVLLFACFALIFAVVFALYDLELEAVGYAAALCLLLGTGVLAVSFFCFCRDHKQRQSLLPQIVYDVSHLPQPKTLAEEEYQQMIRVLGQKSNQLLTAAQEERQQNLEYFMTWVHQIKTPIAAIQMLLQQEDTAEHRALLAELFRVEQYVQMALSYVRLGGENDFIIQEYGLDGIIKQAIHKFAPQFVHRKLRLHYEPTDVRGLTDEKWLLFILEQLLSNAIKYTSAGEVAITVYPDKRISVADTGIGIVPEDLPRIFAKGYTGYNGRYDKKATGLGLYLCQQAAQKLHMDITVSSQPGKGSVFTLALPTQSLEIE